MKIRLAKFIPNALISLGRKASMISTMGWRQFFEFAPQIAVAIHNSRSQLHQDLAFLVASRFQGGGFFVDVGASHPTRFSNTYLLEKFFGFRGVLIEPNPSYHQALRAQRSSPVCPHPLWYERTTVTLQMAGTLSSISSPELSKVPRNRKPVGEMTVETITWSDLALKFEIPRTIDFLSIDVEGAELIILRSIDLSKYRFKFICVEHNFLPHRHQIFELLTRHGYKRIFIHLSEWDDYYIPTSHDRTYSK